MDRAFGTVFLRRGGSDGSPKSGGGCAPSRGVLLPTARGCAASICCPSLVRIAVATGRAAVGVMVVTGSRLHSAPNSRARSRLDKSAAEVMRAMPMSAAAAAVTVLGTRGVLTDLSSPSRASPEAADSVGGTASPRPVGSLSSRRVGCTGGVKSVGMLTAAALAAPKAGDGMPAPPNDSNGGRSREGILVVVARLVRGPPGGRPAFARSQRSTCWYKTTATRCNISVASGARRVLCFGGNTPSIPARRLRGDL